MVGLRLKLALDSPQAPGRPQLEELEVGADLGGGGLDVDGGPADRVQEAGQTGGADLWDDEDCAAADAVVAVGADAGQSMVDDGAEGGHDQPVALHNWERER